MPEGYVGDTLGGESSPTWRLWTMSDPDTRSWSVAPYALNRFSYNGVTLPKFWYNGWLEINANCNAGSGSLYCPMPQGYSVQSIELCPSGYSQTAYDKCCLASDLTTCYEFTKPPTSAPTSPPTFDPNSNLVVNGDFEALNGSGQPTLSPWYMNSGNPAMLELQPTDRGMSALNKDRTSTWNGVEQVLPLEAVQKGSYRLSCYSKIQSGATTDFLQLTLRITTAEYGFTYPGWSTRTLINVNDWTLVEGTVSTDVPGTITEVTVYAEAETVSTNYWVDDVEVVLISAQPTSNPTSAAPTNEVRIFFHFSKIQFLYLLTHMIDCFLMTQPTPGPTTAQPTNAPTTAQPTAIPTLPRTPAPTNEVRRYLFYT